MENPFIKRIQAVPVLGGFKMQDYYVWCASAILGEDGKYHMFASCWEKELGFGANWLFNCKIAHAISTEPQGPYKFSSFVFERRHKSYFDAMNQHNPCIKYHDGTYYLYYFGTTYGGDVPTAATEITAERFVEVWNKKRIGVATSKSVYGPWVRPEKPLLEPRDCSFWDCTCTTNPCVAILPGGKTYMIYKSRSGCERPLQLGVAVADSPNGKFERLTNEPIFKFENPKQFVEDPFIWYKDGKFSLLMKDDFRDESGGITGEWGAGIYAESDDCINWKIAQNPKAYSRKLLWDDGTVTVQNHLERPNLLFSNGEPTHLFAATGSGDKPWHFNDVTWNVCIPLGPDSV